jgi:hypothetical protein
MGAAKKISREEREKILRLQHRYANRISLVRFGKDCMMAGDYSGAIRKYVDYLTVMAEVCKVHDIYSLKVSHFDKRKDITEMLMLSNIYFELARLYDAIPKFHDDSKKCLEQFVHFSANQPFQVVNSEKIRKSIKKISFKNPENFQHAYMQIYVQSKKCYIVTFCYGEDHALTQKYREVKDILLDHRWGMKIVEVYYRFSSRIVPRWEGNSWARFLSHTLIKPSLLLFSKTILRFIIK